MQVEEAGIGSIVVVVLVIVIIVAAAGAYYVLSAQGPTGSSSSHASSSTQSSPTSLTSSSSRTSHPSTTQQSSSTASATVATTCTSTSTTTSGGTTYDFAPLLGNFSSLSVTYAGRSGGNSFTSYSSYTVLYASPTTFKVNATTIGQGGTVSTVAWVKRDGAVIADEYNVGGTMQNFTAPETGGIFGVAMSGFFAEMEYEGVLNAFTSSTYAGVINMTNILVGPTRVQVTNYGMRSLPQTITYCGDSYTFTAFSLQAETAKAASFQLITYFSYQGSELANGQNASVDFTFKITSITA